MKFTGKRFFQLTLSFLLAILFLYFAFRGVRINDLLNALKGANYWWVALLVPVVLLGHWARAVRWKYIMEPIKPNCSIRNLFAGVMIGYAVNNILPRVGELVRPYVLGNLEKISKSAALGSVVVERILDMWSFYLIACVVLLLYPSALDPFFDNPVSIRPLLYIATFAGIVVLLLLFFKVEAVFRFLGRTKAILPKRFSAKIDAILESFYSGFGIVKMKKRFWIILFWSIAIQALYALGMYEPFFAFASMAKPSLDFGAAIVLLVVSSIAWILPAPGAIGTYHSFLTVALVKLYSIDPPTALSYTIVTHELGYITVMVIGFYFYLHDHVRVTEIPDSTAENGLPSN
jgi:uncharacterized protein (TIRG00374 family)